MSRSDRVQVEIERVMTSIDDGMSGLAAAIRDAASINERQRADQALEALFQMARARQTMVSVGQTSPQRRSTPLPTYTAGSMFLEDCFRYLTQKEVESMHFVTGVQTNETFTLDRMLTFELSRQTAVNATGDVNSTHRVLIGIEKYGHKLHAYFHSHPGAGQGATTPSCTDLDYQARLEKGGYPVIGLIFSRDGFFRAFSKDRPFELVVYGKGVEKIDERNYRFTNTQSN